jgi:hypothetical protein
VALDRLLGSWACVMHHVQVAEPVRGRQTYERALDGAFVLLRGTYEHPDFPDAMALLREQGYHYFDVRGLVRTFQLEVTAGDWSIIRRDADFWQRSRTVFVDDDRMQGTGENSYDEGLTWKHDFTMTYERIR